MIHIIVKVDMRNVTLILERNLRGNLTKGGVGINGRELTDIV